MGSRELSTVSVECWTRDGRHIGKEFSGAEYFESDQGSIHTWVTRSAHAIDQLEVAHCDAVSSKLVASDASSEDWYVVVERFWGPSNRAITRRDYHGQTLVSSLAIIELSTPSGTHILRFEPKEDDPVGLVQHTILEPDESIVQVPL